jgi:predicted amidohydrolase YtcJ
MFCRWKDTGFLKPRVVMMLGSDPVRNFIGVLNASKTIIKLNRDTEQRGIISNGASQFYKSDFLTPLDKSQLRLGGVKIILDETTGHLRPAQAELNEMVSGIHQSGFQACLHAVEEKAVEAACSAIEYALRKFPKPDHRHRIEHCSVCPPSLAKRLAALGIMVVTQPSFIYYSGDRYLQTVPAEQLKYLYPIRTLLKSGVKVAASSDCPIAPANPLMGIYAASSRMTETGERVLSKEKITPEEALRMYGECAARTTFEEMMKGSISPGKLADLVMLSDDPTKVPTSELRDIKVEMTILNGEIVWERS